MYARAFQDDKDNILNRQVRTVRHRATRTPLEQVKTVKQDDNNNTSTDRLGLIRLG